MYKLVWDVHIIWDLYIWDVQSNLGFGSPDF